jgi:hypothetical protein
MNKYIAEFIGTFFLGTAAAGGGGMDLQGILANVGGGGVGGAILIAVVGIIKNKMAQK